MEKCDHIVIDYGDNLHNRIQGSFASGDYRILIFINFESEAFIIVDCFNSIKTFVYDAFLLKYVVTTD